jgi:hypothetical protein
MPNPREASRSVPAPVWGSSESGTGTSTTAVTEVVVVGIVEKLGEAIVEVVVAEDEVVAVLGVVDVVVGDTTGPEVVAVVGGAVVVVVVLRQWSSLTPPCWPWTSQSLPFGLGSGRHSRPVRPWSQPS